MDPLGTAALDHGINRAMSGRLAEERPVGGWPDLVKVASMAIGHFNEIADPGFNYMAYVGGSLGLGRPCFTRSRWDWTEAASYALTGRIAARRLTGNLSGLEVEIGQRQLTLASFFDLDGFSHRGYAKGWSEDLDVGLWEQGRVLFTLVAWFLESEDERLLSYVSGLLKALRDASRDEEGQRRFDSRFDVGPFVDMAPLVLVEPLMKYCEITGDPDAAHFCDGIVGWALHSDTHLVDEQYRFSGWLRSLAAGLAAIARYAAFRADDSMLDRVELMMRSAVGLTTRFGATPDTEPCCTNMELSTAAIALARSGRTEWWDLVDRHFRNHTVACQFTDPDAVELGYIDEEPQPADDTRDIIRRSLGGFTWSTAREHIFARSRLMLCCGGNAMWTLGKIAASATTADERGLHVNLHFSLDTPHAAITNYEPFEGKLVVVPRREGPVWVRKPAYASSVDARVDGEAITPRASGGYLRFDDVSAGSAIVLTYPLPERTTVETTQQSPYAGEDNGRGSFAALKREPVLSEEVQTTWRGNTVMAIDYDCDSPHPKHRLYLDREERFRQRQGRDAKTRFFLPDRPYEW